VPQDAGTPSLSLLQIINLSIAVLVNVSPTQGCPRRRVTENHRSGRDRGSNPGHLHGRQRCKPLSHPLRLSNLNLPLSSLSTSPLLLSSTRSSWHPPPSSSSSSSPRPTQTRSRKSSRGDSETGASSESVVGRGQTMSDLDSATASGEAKGSTYSSPCSP
jgi:hypothetical protein